jgi:hypothetical protein
MPTRSATRQQKDAILASGQPFIVATKEVEKITKEYRTDPEIILGCIIVSGTLDTAEVLKTEILFSAGVSLTDVQRAAHTAFRRVWATPTETERSAVIAWAEEIAAFSPRRRRASPFTWNGLAG